MSEYCRNLTLAALYWFDWREKSLKATLLNKIQLSKYDCHDIRYYPDGQISVYDHNFTETFHFKLSEVEEYAAAKNNSG